MGIRKKLEGRAILNHIIGVSAVSLAFLMLISVISYIIPPKVDDIDVSNVVAAKAAELPPNSAKVFRFGNKPAILIRTLQGALKAFSAVCTHLNCTVQYSQKGGFIWCACHNGKFDLNGKVISGPPPKPLEEYRVSVKGEDIIVSPKE